MRYSLILMSAFLTSTPVRAQEVYILTVGLGYDGKHDQYAHDARDMKALLNDKCANTVAQAQTLGGERATLAAFEEKMEAISKKATEKDIVILFFSVHGNTGKKGNFSVRLTDEPLRGKKLASMFDEVKAKIVCMMDTCEAGGMLNHASKNPNVCLLLGCKEDESTTGGKRNPLHGYYANAIYLGLGGAADQNKDHIVTLRELDRYLLNPRNVEGARLQHATSSLPKEMGDLQITKTK